VAAKTQIGRPKQWAEDMQARFSKGTFARIESVLRPGEERTEFVREAVDREIERRIREDRFER
jgi:hypothetical protein